MTQASIEIQGDAVADQPVYWFVVLERAREASDFETAADAIRELRRLGVFVQFGQPTTKEPARV